MLNELRNEIYDDAVKHGLWNCLEIGEAGDVIKRIYCSWLISDELTETIKAIHEPEHYTEELADVIITALSAAGYLGIDIDKAVRTKMEINRGREWRHGK